ncbi:unnamed protein product, partial [Laminaria digitata]
FLGPPPDVKGQGGGANYWPRGPETKPAAAAAAAAAATTAAPSSPSSFRRHPKSHLSEHAGISRGTPAGGGGARGPSPEDGNKETPAGRGRNLSEGTNARGGGGEREQKQEVHQRQQQHQQHQRQQYHHHHQQQQQQQREEEEEEEELQRGGG